MSFLFSEAVAERAVSMVLPAIEPLLKDGTFKRPDLHIVVARPGIPPSTWVRDRWMSDGILYQHSIGDPAKWEGSFADIARSKCYLTWVNGMPTQLIQARAPWLLHQGDTIYYGSAYADGLAVAASGAQPWYDQMVSEWILSAIRGLCINGYQELIAKPNVRFAGDERIETS